MTTNTTQRLQNKNNALLTKTLAKENVKLREDMDTLKSLIQRLSTQLATYQETKYKSNPVQVPIYLNSLGSGLAKTKIDKNEAEKESDSWLKEPRKTLQPLFTAYDRTIEEKNKIIKDQEASLQRIRAQRQKLITENEDILKTAVLHKQKSSVSKDEWHALYDNATVVLQRNDVLSEQVRELKKKIDMLKTTSTETVSKLNARIKDLKESQCNFKTSYSQLENHCAMLTDQISKMTDMLDKRISREDHESSVYECKRLFEELKLSYSEERLVLQDKNAALEKERQRLIEEATELETKNGSLQEDVKTLKDTILIKEGVMENFQKKIQDEAKSNKAKSATVSEMMEVAQAVLSERESLDNALQEQIAVNEHLMRIRAKETELVAELQSKNKIMEELHQQEMVKLRSKVKDMDKLLESIGDRHREEISNLKEIISEKSKRLELIESEKRQMELDLGAVWLATKSKERILDS